MNNLERQIRINVIKYHQIESLKFIEILVGDPHKKISINSLLPIGWEIVETLRNIRINTDPERKRINVPQNYIEIPGHLFSLLHEIGHANHDEGISEEQLEQEIYIRDKFTHSGWDALVTEEKEFFKDVIIINERNAWNYALVTLHKFNQFGIDFEPTMSFQELISYAQQKLSSYEAVLDL